MTSDMNAMPATSGSNQSSVTTVWPSGGSTSSMAMGNDDDDENNGDGDGDNDSGGGGGGEGSSSGAGGRKYERKTRRFAWPDELHRLFVAAIFDLGLKNASPKALLPFMEPAATNAGLTTEHLKSHLQKYRLNYDKSRAEFLAFFDESAKRNGRRRRRTAKSLESHTRFIFPITPGQTEDPLTLPSNQDGAMMEGMPATSQLQINAPAATAAAPAYASLPFSSLTPRSRLKRASFLRLAQQNAAMAFASQSAMGGFGSGISPRDTSPGVDGVTEAQWGMLASLLSPQVSAAPSGTSVPVPAPFSLSDEPSADMQMQMHLAMQAQMNLHRQMLSRKVAVSQHYYNQAAAVKRAAASAMVERALQNAAGSQRQAPPSQQPPLSSGRYYNDPSVAMAPPPPTVRPSIGDAALMQQQQHHRQHQQMLHYQQQQQQQQQQLQQQRFVTSSQADALLGPPWDPMDVDMSIDADDQSDLFGFLKSTE